MQASLIVFDCDGVLVASERSINEVESAYYKRLGLNLSPAEARELFKGKQVAEIAAIVQSKLPAAPNGAWLYDLAMATAQEFVATLKPVPGVADVLDLLGEQSVDMCVASQAPPHRTRFALQLTGLLPAFGDRVFTSFDVERGKPCPDLFLHAAATLGHEPSRCVVVEDSPTGVEAAVAAGMPVLGYAADSDAEELKAAGALVFEHMNELPGLLGVAQ